MSKELATSTFNHAMHALTGNIESYIQTANAIPVLTAEEEYQLATQLGRDNDLEAARKLVLPHLRFVIYVARGYNGYGLPLADLIQEGNIGLMKAIKRFDPERGVRLVSFAVHWIRAEIHEFILRNWRIVKVATTKAQRKLFFNLRSKKKRLGWLNNSEVNAVANELGVKPETVMEMESRLSGQDIGFDGYNNDDDTDYFAPAAYLEHDMADPAIEIEQNDWSGKNTGRLREALSELDERSQDILASRWLRDDKLTLHELATRYSISAERIRQLEQNALRKLKKSLSPSPE